MFFHSFSRSLVSELPPVDGAVGGGGSGNEGGDAAAETPSAFSAAISAENAQAASNTPDEDARRLFVVPAGTWIEISPESASESGGISGLSASGFVAAIASAAGVDSTVDGPLIKMLRDRHLAHIRSAIDAYNSDDGIPLSLLETLEQHQTVDFVEAFKTFLAWLQNPYAFYADKLHLAVVERDAETLTTLLIMRAEDGHMPMVRKMYKKRWINDIVDDLKDAFKGNIAKVLITAAKMTKMLTPTLPPKQQSQRSLLSQNGSSLDPGDGSGGRGSGGGGVDQTPSPVEDKIVEVPSTPFAVGEEEEKENEGEEEKEEEKDAADEGVGAEEAKADASSESKTVDSAAASEKAVSEKAVSEKSDEKDEGESAVPGAAEAAEKTDEAATAGGDSVQKAEDEEAAAAPTLDAAKSEKAVSEKAASEKAASEKAASEKAETASLKSEKSRKSET